MLMTAVHMDSSSSTTTPWLPVFADHHQLLHDFTASASPSASTPPPPSPHHHLLVPRAAPVAAGRVASKRRRPRPSRRLPTTYISADPADFRRMVHKVTGAHDLPQQPPNNNNAAELVLSRPSPIRPAGGGGGALMNTLLPTLDTSAFLVGALSRRATEDAPSCDGSASAVPALQVEAGGACSGNNNCGAGFPTLESWDLALF